MTSEPRKPIEIFFSYSHVDQALRDQLETQLAILKREGLISSWHDRKISAGKEWASEIDAHLNAADIILLLISSDFLASDYCYDIEMKRALERHNAGEARVIPIILRFCDWHNALFGKLQALPTDGKPVTGPSWHNLDEAFYDVAIGIRKAIEEHRTPTAPASLNAGTGRGFPGGKVFEGKPALPRPKLNQTFNRYRIRNEWIDYITSNLQATVEREPILDFYADDINGHKEIRILRNQSTIYSLNIYKGININTGDSGISFSYREGEMINNNGVNAWGNFRWDTEKDVIVLDLLGLSFLPVPYPGHTTAYTYSAGTTAYTKEEFLQALWDRIRRIIENSPE